MEASIIISALAVHLLLLSGSYAMSLGKYNSTVDEVQDDRILALENTIRKLESEIKNITNSKGNKSVAFFFKCCFLYLTTNIHYISHVSICL